MKIRVKKVNDKQRRIKVNKNRSNLSGVAENNKKFIYGLAIILWIILTIFIFNILMHPIEIVEEIKENNITQKTVFTYRADVLPFSLKPTGGLTDIEESVFTKTVKDIVLHIKTSIKADRPVSINGTKKVILKLIAEDLWDKEYILGQEEAFEMDDTDNNIIDEDFIIDIKELVRFMEKIETEIDARPNRYILEITPIIDGTITYNDKEIPIEQDAKTSLNYSQTQICVNEKSGSIKATPIITESIIPQVLNIVGLKIPMKLAKYLFGSIYLVISIISILMGIYHFDEYRSRLSEVQIIDKKHNKRLINIMQEINESAKDKVILDSFRSLIKISDEKEIPILCYKDRNKAIYYAIDGRYIFLYSIDNTFVEDLDLKIHPTAKGSAM